MMSPLLVIRRPLPNSEKYQSEKYQSEIGNVSKLSQDAPTPTVLPNRILNTHGHIAEEEEQKENWEPDILGLLLSLDRGRKQGR